MTLSDRNIIYQTKYFLIFFTTLLLLTACGNKTDQLSTVTESTSGTAVSDREPVPDPEPRKWNTKNKKITESSSKIPEEAWHTYSIKSYSGGLIRPDYDLIQDNLRESWLRFADHNRLP